LLSGGLDGGARLVAMALLAFALLFFLWALWWLENEG
jgi:hypothetical protein